MKKYIQNITGIDERFPDKQEMAFKENGKIIPIKAGEKIETKLGVDAIGSEQRLIIVTDKDDKKKDTKGETQ